MDYYKTHFLRYLGADEETRKASREHWTKCHADNILSERQDMIIFSAQILAGIAMADELLKSK